MMRDAVRDFLTRSLSPPGRRGRAAALAAALALTGAFWVLDYLLLGPAITFTLMYLIPIAAVSWLVGRRAGLIVSLVSTAGWFSVYVTQNPAFSHSFIMYLNLSTKLLIYFSFVYLLDALRAALRHERETARTDFLTGAVNRRYFHEVLERELDRAGRSGKPVTLVYLDVDNFKAINDTFGHDAGDRLLRLAAETVGRNIRRTDTLARLGGDEFALLLPEQEKEAAKVVTAKVRDRLLDMARAHRWPATFSMGAATCVNMRVTPRELIALADRAMYTAKRAGKNRVRFTVYEPPLPQKAGAAGGGKP